MANSTKPLVAPTEIIDAQATAQVAERKRYNDAHRIILDDGSSWTYSTTSAQRPSPFPWFTKDHSVRVGLGDHVPEAGRVHLRLQRVAHPAAVAGGR